jgi:glutamine synthetase
MSLAVPNTVLNTIVAEAIDQLADQLEAATNGSQESHAKAVLAVVKRAWQENKTIVFSGDNYSPDWHSEAERRGLANLAQTPDALPWLVEPSTIEVFSKYDVLSERELHSRYEVSLEQYVTTINIEGETAASIARTMLLPAAIRWLSTLQGVSGVARLTEESAELVEQFTDAIFALEEANEQYPEDENSLDGAKYVQGRVMPAMAAVREVADKLERIVPDDLWPLPKYSEILFIK